MNELSTKWWKLFKKNYLCIRFSQRWYFVRFELKEIQTEGKSLRKQMISTVKFLLLNELMYGLLLANIWIQWIATILESLLICYKNVLSRFFYLNYVQLNTDIWCSKISSWVNFLVTLIVLFQYSLFVSKLFFFL